MLIGTHASRCTPINDLRSVIRQPSFPTVLVGKQTKLTILEPDWLTEDSKFGFLQMGYLKNWNLS